MKIPLKYGLLITAIVVAWIVIVRFVANAGQDSVLASVGPLVFNLAQFLLIFLGIRERKSEDRQFTFREGVKTGTGISFVYALSACLFFGIVLLAIGPKLLITDMGPSNRPIWLDAAIAFAGLFLGGMILGVIYSALSSFVLARQRPAES